MLRESGEISDLDKTDRLFDESELLDSSNPLAGKSDQDSTLEAENSQKSAMMKTNLNLALVKQKKI